MNRRKGQPGKVRKQAMPPLQAYIARAAGTNSPTCCVHRIIRGPDDFAVKAMALECTNLLKASAEPPPADPQAIIERLGVEMLDL
eukprot:CAMPEP_0115349186 /NCGR_PEP_ID=MMETSP0270-20121206/95792_1 /TAXON_ID=71861 /ORGANISM="Scrippsiella trochoidea, Strain CCMP3099" /LENGTH=84 /DNA_ID=CAMNT_0002771183 /DNA_START=79 /DNA_END=334 /DNA_ORIENTATION=+